MLLAQVRPIGDEASQIDEFAKAEYRRKPVLQREVGKPPLIEDHERVGENNQGLRVLAGHAGKCLVDLGGRACLESAHGKVQPAGGFLGLLVLQCLVAILRIVEDRDAGECRNKFLEQLESFARQVGGNAGQAGRLAAGSGDAGDQTVEWIAGRNDDGNGGACFLGRLQALIAGDEQQVHVEAEQLARERGKTIEITPRPPGLNGDVLALDIAQLAQPLPEHVKEKLVRRLGELSGFGPQKAKIFAALLGKQVGARPKGWRESSAPYGAAGSFISAADVVDNFLERIHVENADEFRTACTTQIRFMLKLAAISEKPFIEGLTMSKIKRVIQKVIPDAPHEVMLILDGSTGQNAVEQARQFTAATDVTALAITKLDGTAKGGVVLAIANQFKIPVKFIGVGEKMEDILVFDKHEFVDSLFSIDDKTSN